MSSKGRLFVLSAPAGTGKTTLVNRLMEEVPRVVQSVSYTTRQPRPGEVEGIHYHFITKREFEERIAHGDFLEYVTLYGDYYGTALSEMEEKLKQGNRVFLVIDTQGAEKIRGKVSATYIFLSPPSLEILKERLVQRNTETKEKIAARLEVAKEELSKKDLYDVEIVNDQLEEAFQKLKTIVVS